MKSDCSPRRTRIGPADWRRPVGVLSDRVCVLVGGGGGIGTATAVAYAREGAAVVVADLNDELAEAAAEAVRAGGGDAWSARVDALEEGGSTR